MIRPLTLKAVAECCGGQLVGQDLAFEQVSIDSRRIVAGDLFVALIGDNFDGHDFVQAVVDAGACAVIVQKPVENIAIPYCLVEDTTKALGQIAALHRESFTGKLAAITGSSGKTTVKGMLASILYAAVGEDRAFATQGNLNNHIGVPLSLLSLGAKHQYAVIEMGASAVGEIDYLTHLANPDVALVNNVMPAHIEGFGSLDRIADAKGEIYHGLKACGVAIVNGGDVYANQWLAQNQQQRPGEAVKVFAENQSSIADYWVENIVQGLRGCFGFDLCSQVARSAIELSVLGKHNIANALAAASCAKALGIDDAFIQQGLHQFNGEKGRLQVKQGLNGSTIIDDSYNANPGSVKAAIDLLSEFAQTTVLVLGQLAELGDNAAAMHADLGRYAAEKNVSHLLLKGEFSSAAEEGFAAGGGASVSCYDEFESLIDALSQLANEETTILIKGSRSAMMETVVNAITIDGVEK